MKGIKGELKAREEFTRGIAMRVNVLQLSFNVVNKDKRWDSEPETPTAQTPRQRQIYFPAFDLSLCWFGFVWV